MVKLKSTNIQRRGRPVLARKTSGGCGKRVITPVALRSLEGRDSHLLRAYCSLSLSPHRSSGRGLIVYNGGVRYIEGVAEAQVGNLQAP